MRQTLLFFLFLVLLMSASVFARPERFDIEVEGIPNTVYYWIRRPDSFERDKVWPLLIHLPGSNPAETETVTSNCAIRDANFWSTKQGMEEFFFVSVWYGNNNDAYPHGFKKNAVTITAAMIRNALQRFPIDRTRIFLQSYSQGGVLVRNMLDKYAKKTPITFAGMLFNDSNCQGSNPASACVTPDTAVFIGVGSRDIPEVTGLECVKEAEQWARIFKNKCKDLEHHVIEGQEHEPNAEHFELVKKWLARVMNKISEQNIETAARNSSKARSMVKRGRLGAALDLTAMALAETAEDNPQFELSAAIAAAVQAELTALQEAYTAWDDEDPVPAATALLALHTLFKGHPAGDAATVKLKERLKDRALSRVFGKAKKQLKTVTKPAVQRVQEALEVKE